MAGKVSLTKAIVENAKPPKSGRDSILDARTPGLSLRITANGAKSFYVIKKINGRTTRVFLAKWPDVSIEQVRKMAVEVVVRLAKGENITAERRKDRAAVTLKDAFDYYLEHHAKPRLRSWKQSEWQFNRYLKKWHNRRLNDVSRGDCSVLLSKIAGEYGETTANRLKALLSVIFNVARQELNLESENPVAGVKLFKENKRERYITPLELPTLLQAIEAEPSELFQDFFKLALFTGARRANLQSARQDEFDLSRGIWTIPATKAKAGKPIYIPLTSQALEVVKRRINAVGNGEWLFPGRRGGHLLEPKTAWKRICERAGLTGVRIHDLRHTCASFMVAGGASLFVVGKVLGHASQQTTARYSHLEDETLRNALGTATAAMTAKPKATKAPAKQIKAKGKTDGKA